MTFRTPRSVASLCVACAALLLLLAPPTLAQFPFEGRSEVKAHSPALPAGAFGTLDVDADGDLDLVVDDRIYLNQGAGVFFDDSAARMPTPRGGASEVFVEDLDGDGHADLMLLYGSGPRCLMNDGTGRFVDQTAARLPRSEPMTSMALGDVDGDGDLDLAVGRVKDNGRSHRITTDPIQNELWLNDGAGRFLDVTPSHMPVLLDRTFTVVLIDLEGDGDLDLVFGNRQAFSGDTPSRVCRNDGRGRFVESTGLPETLDWIYPWYPLAAVDVDQDGDLDLLTNGGGRGEGLLRNDGTGRFAADAMLPPLHGLHARTDVDLDGDLDLVYPSGQVLVNDGRGVYVDETTTRMPIGTASGAVLALDAEGDGDQDLFFGNGVRHLNDGTGAFVATLTDTLPGLLARTGGGIAVADFDGDGRADFVYGGLLLLQHEGRFVSRGPLPGSPTHFFDFAAIDVDDDGDIDLAAANGDARLYLNDGQGNLSLAPAGQLPVFAGGGAYGVVAADLDGDGDMDLAFAAGSVSASDCRFAGRDTLYLNDGSGQFVESASRLPPVADHGVDVAVGDVDGDGHPDLVFANGNYAPPALSPCDRNRVVLNDGTGSFRDAGTLPGAPDLSHAVALGDVDGDGDLDLVFGNVGQDRLLLNDGGGTFTDVTSTHLPARIDMITRSIAIGDFDEDGHPDLVMAGFAGANARTWMLRNDGSGRFTDVSAAMAELASLGSSTTVALEDLNGDGDLDLLQLCSAWIPGTGGWGGGGGPNHCPIVYRTLATNLRRELEAPRLALLGQPYELRILSRGSSVVDVAIPMVSAGTSSIPLPPFGTLGLDPATLVALPPQVIEKATGETNFEIGIPNDPTLAGSRFHVQALVVRWPGSARLTHVVSETIRP